MTERPPTVAQWAAGPPSGDDTTLFSAPYAAGVAAGRRQAAAEDAVIDAAHLARQRAFSSRTFGPGPRTEAVLDHIRKELAEIEASPYDLGEWVDVVILALDGAWRAGHEPRQIIDAIAAKQARNEARRWPDWRTAEPDKAIEHVRDAASARPVQVATEHPTVRKVAYKAPLATCDCAYCGDPVVFNLAVGYVAHLDADGGTNCDRPWPGPEPEEA